jgi:hypothetical protein
MSTEQLLTFARWSGYFTLFCAALTGLGWILKWGIRFRLVGVTGFMGVLTGGLFALSLGLYSRPDIPGAVRYWRVFDTGSTQVVITVPNTITESELDATLRQAASKLFSPGRMSQGEEFITIRARTVLHPEPGVTQPLYLGQVKRSLLNREDNTPIVEIFADKLAQLPKVESDGG